MQLKRKAKLPTVIGLKSFKEAAISLRHLEKSILEGNLYLGPLEMILRTLASGMTFRLPVITCPAEGYK